MRTRGEARREAAAAAAQHAALLAAVERVASSWTADRSPELEAVLAAIGPPGSPAVLAALSTDDHALLRAACPLMGRLAHAVPPLLRAYGESEACAAVMSALDDSDRATSLMNACYSGHAGATVALLGAYRRAGRAHEVLEAGGHIALCLAADSNKPEGAEIVRLLLAEYGEPGSDAVLAALAAGGHHALRGACANGSARAAALLAAAYGPPGCAALRATLVERDRTVLMELFSATIHCRRSNRDRLASQAEYDAALAALLAALGEPDCASALRELGAWLEAPKSAASGIAGFRLEPAQRLARIPPDSLLARLAAATPATWALNPNAARALLSAPVRASLALPALLALRRLPGGAAAPVAAHLRARPWLLFAGAAATALAAAAAAPPPA
jgi:hypothetical protein